MAINKAFGDKVKLTLGGMSTRDTSAKTGIGYSTISKMRLGHVPTERVIIGFAQGLHLDVNEWLQLAGYEPIGVQTSNQSFNTKRGQKPKQGPYNEASPLPPYEEIKDRPIEEINQLIQHAFALIKTDSHVQFGGFHTDNRRLTNAQMFQEIKRYEAITHRRILPEDIDIRE